MRKLLVLTVLLALSPSAAQGHRHNRVSRFTVVPGTIRTHTLARGPNMQLLSVTVNGEAVVIGDKIGDAAVMYGGAVMLRFYTHHNVQSVDAASLRKRSARVVVRFYIHR